MSTEMDWYHDYCLSCDRQLSEGAYCSQACRLADLENTNSNTTSVNTHNHTHSGFYLPPAVDFATHSQSAERSKAYSQQSSPSTHYYTYYSPPSPTCSSYSSTSSSTAQTSQTQAKRLSASSSHSSLSSVSGNQTAPGLTPQAASALQGYVSSFDQVREHKRRYRS
ncbi:hypothetical protein EJ05DRAFT_484704 [Pseudovirgaria hyperparasitica]|uniref:Life-span regulatory factor domain-containing protein n=1 Tax=Pseudovirgaria hyperparasitica TaxID=470096 RepID=A0A6A6WAB1_9PEZI|nr:uncharacterized protein EJ05DRAFT_484704 [Pseudovirgaria hyperparasitica]KAF2759798.1 hypothetical protein EJ05DRAFT_484704 [Pseudovirgaria hyperparasitica]